MKGSGSITTLASFNATTGSPITGGLATLTIDSQGNLYGTTASGGAHGFGTVFEIAKGSNTITTLVSFTSADDNPIIGAGTCTSVTVDSHGNLFGVTTGGSPSGDGTLFEIVKGSNSITTSRVLTRRQQVGVPWVTSWWV